MRLQSDSYETARYHVWLVGDLRLRIAEADLRDAGDGIRWAPAGFFRQDGDPAPVCTRAALQRMVAILAAAGFEAAVGTRSSSC